MMKPEQVEAICHSLSPLLRNTIRSKILNCQSLPTTYTFGEALTFWVGDMLIGSKLVTSEQLRVILEEFSGRIVHFGNELQDVWLKEKPRGLPEYKKLPICKIGFLDRRLVCMDGQAFFLDLTTGTRVPAADNWPLETLAYNLTMLFVRYNTKMVNAMMKLGVSELGEINAGR
jgi:hypothetical protein